MHDVIENRAILELGIHAVDEQHDALADVLNRLARQVHAEALPSARRRALPERLSFEDCRDVDGGPSDTSTFETIRALLDELVHLSETHFADEEGLMAQTGFSGLSEHRREHQLLLAELKEFVRDVCAGREALEICHLLALKDWFVGHVVLSDREFAEFLHASEGKGSRTVT